MVRFKRIYCTIGVNWYIHTQFSFCFQLCCSSPHFSVQVLHGVVVTIHSCKKERKHVTHGCTRLILTPCLCFTLFDLLCFASFLFFFCWQHGSVQKLTEFRSLYVSIAGVEMLKWVPTSESCDSKKKQSAAIPEILSTSGTRDGKGGGTLKFPEKIETHSNTQLLLASVFTGWGFVLFMYVQKVCIKKNKLKSKIQGWRLPKESAFLKKLLCRRCKSPLVSRRIELKPDKGCKQKVMDQEIEWICFSTSRCDQLREISDRAEADWEFRFSHRAACPFAVSLAETASVCTFPVTNLGRLKS